MIMQKYKIKGRTNEGEPATFRIKICRTGIAIEKTYFAKDPNPDISCPVEYRFGKWYCRENLIIKPSTLTKILCLYTDTIEGVSNE